MGREASEWVGSNALTLVHPDDLQFALLSLTSVAGKEVGTPIEVRMRLGADWLLVEIVGAPLDDGQIVLSMRDVTDRRRWEIASGDGPRFQALVQHAASITMLVDSEGNVASTSGASTRLLGLDQEVVHGRPIARIVHPDDRMAVRAGFVTAAATAIGTPATTVQARVSTSQGDYIPFELSIVSLLDDPTVQGFVVSAHDITQLREMQAALAEQANTDALTGLLNRRAFDVALEREWVLTSRDGIVSYLLVGDLDGFKALNDRHGHAAGDEALKGVAQALRESVRDTDIAARIGGDEFAVILVRCGGEAAAIGFSSVLEDRIQERTRLLPTPIGITLGHVSLLASGSAAGALHAADSAMLARKLHR